MSNSVFSQLQKDVETIKAVTNDLEDKFEIKFGNSILELFEVLHSLFNNLNLLTEEKGEEEKFKFIHAYPDEIYDGFNNIVTFDIIRRTPFIVDNKTLSTAKTKYLKPRFVKDQYNSVTGNVEEIFAAVFSNVISINCFSNKARTLNNMVSLIESIFYKYSSYIKKHIDQFSYIGTGPIQFYPKNDQTDRLFSRELQFQVVTSEIYPLELERIKSIDIRNKHN